MVAEKTCALALSKPFLGNENENGTSAALLPLWICAEVEQIEEFGQQIPLELHYRVLLMDVFFQFFAQVWPQQTCT